MDKIDRTKFIGASDCASVLGLSRWKTLLQVWGEKTGNIIAEDISDKLPVKLGNMLEETVAKLYMEETGEKVRRVSEAYVHKQFPFIQCHIDRKIEGKSGILQCKTASAWKSKEWEGEEIPQEYILQEYHELACTDYEFADIAVLIGNSQFKIKRITRDDKIIKDIIKKEVDFWNNYVLTNQMPFVVTKDDADTLFALFPEGQTKEIELDDKANAIIESLQALGKDKVNIENIIETQRNTLKAMLKDADTGTTDLYTVTWRNQITKRIDTELFKKREPEIYAKYCKASPSRVLRFKSKKEVA